MRLRLDFDVTLEGGAEIPGLTADFGMHASLDLIPIAFYIYAVVTNRETRHTTLPTSSLSYWYWFTGPGARGAPM